MNESLLNRILKDHKRRTRSLALILCLSMIVSLGTFAGFHKNAIAKVYTREVLDCPFTHEGAEPVAHVHNDDCYEGETLVCTLPEREAHTHDDTCYAESRMLSCGLEENPGHQHTEACFDENGELTCQIPEGEGAHVHTDACYTIERALICNQPELPVHVHDAGCFRTEEITVDEPEGTAASEQAVSTVPEMPVSDPNADLETADDWNREFENLELSGNWARDLVLVAATQQGRGESPNNFEAVLNDAGDAWVRHGYTRYGAWYGYPYAEWDAMFVSFCLRYAGIPAENVPNNPTAAFMAESFSMGGLFAGRDYIPAVGDLIFFDTVVDDEITNIDHMGIVYHVDAENGTINTVEGDRTEAVATFGYYLNDEQIVGYGILPQNPNYISTEEENTDITDEAFDGFIFMTTDEEEEKQEETTTAEDVTAAAVPMPAQSWERTAGGIKVSVEAPEGAFPENTKIAVTPVNGSSLKDTVSDAVDGEVLEVQAVDITFFDAEGREIEPAVPIRVTMTPAATEHAEEKTSVVHVDVAQQTAELIEQAEGTEADNSEVVFDAEAFTIYAIVYTVDFEYGVNGKTFTSSMPGAEDMPLSEIVKGLGIVDEEELETFLSKIVSVTSTNEEVAVVTEDRSVRVLKDGDAQIVITMQDGAAFSIDVNAEGITEISDENAVATVSTVNDLYLPASGEVKAELLNEELGGNAIAAVQTAAESEENSAAAESSSYQAFSIALENVDVTAYDGFNVAVALPEDAVVGRDFQLYQVKEDGTATDITESLTVTGEPNEDGLQNVSGISFTTEDFADFVLSYSIETYYTTAGGDTYKITLNYGPKAGIPDGAELKVQEILPEDEKYTEYYTKAVKAVSGTDEAVQLTEDSYARFFNIEIWAEGEKVEPKAEVSVNVSLKDAPKDNPADLNVVHFGEGDPAVLKSESTVNEESGTTELAFVTDSFSVYGVITVPAPSSVNDLNGYSVKISNLGYFLGADNITVGDSRRLSKTNNEAEAPVWTFEATGTAGQYHIYTETEEGKQYINIKYATDQRGDVMLSSEPQALTVSKNENNYRICGTDNSWTYYLNQFDNTSGTGFAGWWYKGSAEAQLDFTFVPSLAETNEKEYLVVVKQGDQYYVVLNDGALSPAQYNEANNTVVVDDPMMWKYDGNRLYHETREAGFTDFDTASASYYRYIDPNSPNGLNEDNENNTVRRGTSGVNQNGINGVVIDSRDLWDSVQFSYTDHKLQSTSNPSYYIGVDEQGRLKGQVSAENAVEVFLADPLVLGSDWVRHSVGHIDISINGTAEADVPLAYGKYYDEHGNMIKEVKQNQFEKLHLTKAQVVDMADLSITPADMKRSRITASWMGEDLDNAFYIIGYSGNAEHGGQAGGETDYLTSPQVRIEGSFLVAKMPENHATIETWLYDNNQDYRNDIRQEHLANQVEYNVSVTKSVEFYLKMPVTDSNGQTTYQQLYDADGKALTIKVDLTFSDSFTYWDTENECPVFRDTNKWYYYKNTGPKEGWQADDWEAGDVARCGYSGMDFKLGADSEADVKTYAIEITKLVVDENGNRIKSDAPFNNKFYIYRSSAATSDSVKDINVGSFTEEPDYTDYVLRHDKQLTVGEDGFGLTYDYDVTPGVYLIQEDKDSIPESVTDVTGVEWSYKETYFFTEYAWRDCPNDSYMHVSKTFTGLDNDSYKSAPEILGDHPLYNGSGNATNDFLEFFVYNVYESPKVNVPVIKTWTEFEENDYDWTATFKLQYAPLYADSGAATGSFIDVTPIQTITITKSDMAGVSQELVQKYLSGDDSLTAEEISQIEKITFKNLPKYGTDLNGNAFRYQYSLEEVSYAVTNTSTGTVVSSWNEVTGYSSPDEDTHYTAFYPHDAGENIFDSPADNTSDENYYIDVTNALKNIRKKEYIKASLSKQWDTSFTNLDTNRYAKFNLKRYSYSEYRDLSRMTDADRAADPITVTIINNDTVINQLEVQPNVGLYLGAYFAPHDNPVSVSFTADKSLTLSDGTITQSLSAEATRPNASNALVRSQEFFVTEDTVFTLGSSEPLAPGSNYVKVLDTGAGTAPVKDKSFSRTVTLNQDNNWTADFIDLIRSETHAGDNDNNENVTFYEYYFEEVEGNPDGYPQYYRIINNTASDINSGDVDHRIIDNDSIVAINGPTNRLIVKKEWRGVPDTTGFPKVTFTLYWTWADDQNGTYAKIFEKDGVEYKNIELKGDSYTWICPIDLPPTMNDSSQNGNPSRAVKYFVREDTTTGQSQDGSLTTNWKFYYYYNSNKVKYNDQAGHQVALPGAEIADKGGTITICNKLEDEYINLDIQKQFFEIVDDAGAIGNVTAQMMRDDVVLGFIVQRAIKTADGNYLGEDGQPSDTRVWMDYSGEMLCGYENDSPVHKNDPDNIFNLQGGDDVGGEFHYRILNNNGDASPSGPIGGSSGLPTTGYYIRNGESVPVEYEYTFRETNVYKNLNKDPYPEWDWYSSILPGKYNKIIDRQDQARIANIRASNIIISKEWSGTPAAEAVYLKVWRYVGNHTEDFTAVIADDIRYHNNYQQYVDDVNCVDLDRNCLILKPDENGSWENATVTINRALLHPITLNGTYEYYIQEVGYLTSGGEYRTNVGRFRPAYNKWIDGNWGTAPVGMDAYASNHMHLGTRDSNRFKVINTAQPTTSYSITKRYSGQQSSTGSQSSVTDRYPTDGSSQVVVQLMQRYRYEKTENGVEYVSADNVNWTPANDPDAANIWTVEWQGAESASPVSVALPLPKPEGIGISDEAWLASPDAWTFTWDGLDIYKVLADDTDPNQVRRAQLYYKAVEVSTPGWLSEHIQDEDQDGKKAIDDDTQTSVDIQLEKNDITNIQNQCDLKINKEWTGLGTGKTWPEGYVVYYQVMQNLHLAITDVSKTIEKDGLTYIDPEYSYSPVFKSIGMTNSSAEAARADQVHPRAVSTIENTKGMELTGLPRYGFYTATDEDVEAASRVGVALEAGKVYAVVYTYSVRETAVKKNGENVGFKPQTVDAEENQAASEGTGEGGTATGAETNAKTYVATLTNEFTSVTVEKQWNGLRPGNDESATIQLMYFEKDIELEPENTFPVTVSASEWESGIDANNEGSITVTFTADGKTPVSVILNSSNQWTSTVNLDNDATWSANYSGDGNILDATVERLSGTTEDITEETHITLKGKGKQTGITVSISVTSGYYNTNNGNNYGGNLELSQLTDGYVTFVIKDPSNNYAVVFENGRLDPTNGWKQTGIVLPSKQNGQYKVEFSSDGKKVISANNQDININSGQINYSIQTQVRYSDPNMEPAADGTVHITGGNYNITWKLKPNHNYTVSFKYTAAWNEVQFMLNDTTELWAHKQNDSDWGNDFDTNKTYSFLLSVPATGETSIKIVGQPYNVFNLAYEDNGEILNTTAGQRTNMMKSTLRTLTASSLRAPAEIIWNNITSDLPNGADPNNDHIVDTVIFSGNTWSKTWDELPKYSEDGKKVYVYYAYETDYAGASGASAMTTTYSTDEDGKLIVTNTPTMPDNGNLTVNKQVFYGESLNTEVNNRNFTFGIFTDQAGTERVSGQEDRTITVSEGVGTVTFTGLEANTDYYVYEIVNGEPVTSEGIAATISGIDYTVTYSDMPTDVLNGNTAYVTITNKQKPYELEILKVDKENNSVKLEGAEFELNKLVYDAENRRTSYVENTKQIKGTNNQGIAVFDPLALGFYEIKETGTPDGYIVSENTAFYISVDSTGIKLLNKGDGDPRTWTDVQTTGNVISLVAEQDSHIKYLATVGNTPGTQLPQTGGIGATLFTALGGFMTATAGAILTIRRKRKPAEG